MKIAAIHAHPDDIEFLCAGTLALLKQAGHTIVMTTFTPGDKGTPNLTSEEISRVRRDEAAASAALIGAEYHCLEMKDLELVDDNPSRAIATEHLRAVNPDIVITASPVDYMIDHEVVSSLVRTACFFAGVRNYRCGSAPAMDHIPVLYYMDPIEGIDIYGNKIIPEFCVDCSSAMPIKEQMLSCHASQREWLRSHHGVDEYIESMIRWSRERGEPAGCSHAEGFRQHKGHAYPKENVLARLLQPHLIKSIG